MIPKLACIPVVFINKDIKKQGGESVEGRGERKGRWEGDERRGRGEEEGRKSSVSVVALPEVQVLDVILACFTNALFFGVR